MPDFVCYHASTYANSIIKANTKDNIYIALLSKYINCYYKEQSTKHKFVISVYDHWCTRQKIMQNQSVNLLKETYQKTNINIVSMIKKSLLNDLYINGQCNRKYIESVYNDDFFNFNFIITGFDDLTHQFILYGINQSDNFTSYRVGYSIFEQALFDTPKPNIPLTFWQYNKDAKFLIDLPNLIFELEDYIHSTNNRNHYTADKVYGLAAINALAEHLSMSAIVDGSMNEAYIYKFMLHKCYMTQRVTCLVNNSIINHKWIMYAQEVEEIGKTINELGKGFNNSHDLLLIKKVTDCIALSIHIEQDYLQPMLNEIKNYAEITT